MIRSINKIIGYNLAAVDGEIGHCQDLLFDDENWIGRFMVADTGSWLTDRSTLDSPICLGQPDCESNSFPVLLTKNEIEMCPPLDTEAPASRQFDQQWHAHFSWPRYWLGGLIWGAVALPTQVTSLTTGQHSRSSNVVTNYRIHANDGDIGHVEDFLVDDHDWRIRYVLVVTANWLPARKAILSPDWISNESWADSSVSVVQSKMPSKNVQYSILICLSTGSMNRRWRFLRQAGLSVDEHSERKTNAQSVRKNRLQGAHTQAPQRIW